MLPSVLWDLLTHMSDSLSTAPCYSHITLRSRYPASRYSVVASVLPAPCPSQGSLLHTKVHAIAAGEQMSSTASRGITWSVGSSTLAGPWQALPLALNESPHPQRRGVPMA